MNINENAAYLKGLLDGSDLNRESKEIKILSGALDLIYDMAEKISELEAECAELKEYIEEIDEDLGTVEEDLYFTEDDDECDCEDDSEYYSMTCPSCGEEVFFDDSLAPDELVCPACGEKFDDVEVADTDSDN